MACQTNIKHGSSYLTENIGLTPRTHGLMVRMYIYEIALSWNSTHNEKQGGHSRNTH